MKVVLQRVKEANVTIDGQVHGAIQQGYLLLVGIEDSDTMEMVEKMAKKCVECRIFEDENHKMNLSLKDINGAILSISQFTLLADCKKGRRPSFAKAGKPAHASKMYDLFNECLRRYDVEVQTGIFGADMQVGLINDGPVTLVLESGEI